MNPPECHHENSPQVLPADAEQRIVDAWLGVAAAWTAAVREARIESRRLATDRAIVDTVLAHGGRRVLDIGCGEGWLARALAAHGREVHGLDVAPDLIERARELGGATFAVMSYAQIAAGALSGRYDVCVCNFSLLGESSVDALIAAIPALLEPGGALIVQTLHPHAASREQAYRDGWREGSWAGIGDDLGDPAPWYFRTIESWIALLSRGGLALTRLVEPRHPTTAEPLSLILVAESRPAPRIESLSANG